MQYKLLLNMCLVTALVAGCASTHVCKNPGQHDNGVRFYRPKPYLVLQPAEVNKEILPNAVQISLDYLPDYSEEYSIHVNAGIGKNHTNITLEHGWKLTKIKYEVDSKTHENIEAAGELAAAVGKYVKTGAELDAAKAANKSNGGPQIIAEMVPAFNVPLGYYESVISVDSCGKKRLYGWRYVGFSPYEPCPTCPMGVETSNCQNRQVYGLASQDGVMVFKLLDALASEDFTPKKPIIVPVGKDELYDVVAQNFGDITLAVNEQFPDPKPAITHDTSEDMTSKEGTVTITVTVSDLKSYVPEELEKLWKSQIENALKSHFNTRPFKVVVKVKKIVP